MKKNELFHANSLVYLIEIYLEWMYRINQKLAKVLDWVLIPVWFVLLPLWVWFYMLDIVSNVYDYVCMKVFVELPLWGLKNSVKIS